MITIITHNNNNNYNKNNDNNNKHTKIIHSKCTTFNTKPSITQVDVDGLCHSIQRFHFSLLNHKQCTSKDDVFAIKRHALIPPITVIGSENGGNSEEKPQTEVKSLQKKNFNWK